MKRILVVDDEDSLRALVVAELQRHGYETIEASNGVDAVDMATKNLPDLIISDVMMDSGSGFMLQELLKENPKTVSIPIILMTGLAMKAGAWGSSPDVEYLQKPFSEPELLKAVQHKLGA